MLSTVDVFDIYCSDRADEDLAQEYGITAEDVLEIKMSPESYMAKHLSNRKPPTWNEKDIIAIYKACPLIPDAELAKKYGMNKQSVHNIRHYRTHRHITRGLPSPFVGITLLQEGTVSGKLAYKKLRSGDKNRYQEYEDD